MSTYYCLTDDDAKRYLRERNNEDSISLDDIVRRVGHGELIDLQPINILHSQLHDRKDDYPDKLSLRDREGGRFEQQGCELVHQYLSIYPRVILSDPAFWTWLAVVSFSDIIEWRFGSSPASTKYENYGIGKPAENMIFRMWMRGEIGIEPTASDPYELARAGDQDLWRSHIIRQGYSNARQMARSLLRLQSGKLGCDRLDVDGIRDLAKQIRRLHANVLFEILPDHRADALVLELCNELRANR